jgi:hypothetical protein
LLRQWKTESGETYRVLTLVDAACCQGIDREFLLLKMSPELRQSVASRWKIFDRLRLIDYAACLEAVNRYAAELAVKLGSGKRGLRLHVDLAIGAVEAAYSIGGEIGSEQLRSKFRRGDLPIPSESRVQYWMSRFIEPFVSQRRTQNLSTFVSGEVERVASVQLRKLKSPPQ